MLVPKAARRIGRHILNPGVFLTLFVFAGVFKADLEPLVPSWFDLTAILGRTAAYERRKVSWVELLQANVRWEPDLEGLNS